MPKDLDANDLLLFAQVIDSGSFTRVAERTGLPKSTLSRRITTLEQQLGERLITRSTRRLTITDFGEGILEHARRMLEESTAASAFAQHRQAVPSGRLRVSLPPDFSEFVLAPFFLQFAADYPEIRLELDISTRRVDLIGENFDLAIRMAQRLPDDATLVARRLCELPGGLYASRAYLKQRGTPQTPDDLLSHTGLHLITSAGEVQDWVLHKDQHSWSGLPGGPLAANSIGLMRTLAAHGLGIAQLTQRFAQPLVDDGLLARVLPEWHNPPVTMWGVIPGRRLLPARTKVFLDALIRVMKQTTG